MKATFFTLLFLIANVVLIAQDKDEVTFMEQIQILEKLNPSKETHIKEFIGLRISRQQRLLWKNSKSLKLSGFVIKSPYVLDGVYLKDGILVLTGKNYQPGTILDNGKTSEGFTIYTDALYIPIPKPAFRLHNAWVENPTDQTYIEYLYGIEIGEKIIDFKHTRKIIPYCVLQVDITNGTIKILGYNDNRYSMENEYYD